jgi:hypothetical protein
VKFATLPNHGYRQYFPDAEDANGFDVFAFIDNTITSTCRPGGGPRSGGEQAPRYPQLVQQAFYTGWKKLHGLKWQTVDLPNGMNYEVWGAASVRHNDNYTLGESGILAKMAHDQRGWPKAMKILGDSAYTNGAHIRVVGDGRGWSSLREAIEWGYKDLKTLWKYIDYRHSLKLRKQPIAKIIFVSMLLKNAYICMNGCQAALYFNINPPSFEEWVLAGRKARELPDNVNF